MVSFSTYPPSPPPPPSPAHSFQGDSTAVCRLQRLLLLLAICSAGAFSPVGSRMLLPSTATVPAGVSSVLRPRAMHGACGRGVERKTRVSPRLSADQRQNNANENASDASEQRLFIDKLDPSVCAYVLLEQRDVCVCVCEHTLNIRTCGHGKQRDMSDQLIKMSDQRLLPHVCC